MMLTTLSLISVSDINRPINLAPKAYESTPDSACQIKDAITDLKQALINKTAVCHLDLSGQNLEILPVEIFQLINLEVLKLSSNNLDNIPGELAFLPLQQLDLSNNNLTEIPDTFDNFEVLKQINISGNPLPASEILKLKSLLPNTTIGTGSK